MVLMIHDFGKALSPIQITLLHNVKPLLDNQGLHVYGAALLLSRRFYHVD